MVLYNEEVDKYFCMYVFNGTTDNLVAVCKRVVTRHAQRHVAIYPTSLSQPTSQPKDNPELQARCAMSCTTNIFDYWYYIYLRTEFVLIS